MFGFRSNDWGSCSADASGLKNPKTIWPARASSLKENKKSDVFGRLPITTLNSCSVFRITRAVTRKGGHSIRWTSLSKPPARAASTSDSHGELEGWPERWGEIGGLAFR